jgi:hypothetical protein
MAGRKPGRFRWLPLRRYIRGQLGRQQLLGAQIVCGVLARTLIANEVVRDLLTIVETAQTRTLDCRNMNEHVSRAIIRLDEAEALGAVEPLDGTSIHNDRLSMLVITQRLFARFDRF